MGVPFDVKREHRGVETECKAWPFMTIGQTSNNVYSETRTYVLQLLYGTPYLLPFALVNDEDLDSVLFHLFQAPTTGTYVSSTRYHYTRVVRASIRT